MNSFHYTLLFWIIFFFKFLLETQCFLTSDLYLFSDFEKIKNLSKATFTFFYNFYKFFNSLGSIEE